MKLVFRGWSRNCGPHLLVDHDICEIELSAPGDYWSSRREPVSIRRVEDEERDGSLVLSAKASGIDLNGSFRVELRLTKDEIANLAKIALKDEPFGDVADLLSSCKACESRKQSEFEERMKKRREERHRLVQSANAG